MPKFSSRFSVPAPLQVVRAFHGDSAALKALTPPPMLIRLHRFGALEEGMEARFTLWLGPIPIHWTALHEDVSDRGFVDVQVQGPLSSWRHRHRFEPVSESETEVFDTIEYEHARGLSGLRSRMLFSNWALYGLFQYRKFATRRACRRLISDRSSAA